MLCCCSMILRWSRWTSATDKLVDVEELFCCSGSPINLRVDKIGDVILRLLSNGFWWVMACSSLCLVLCANSCDSFNWARILAISWQRWLCSFWDSFNWDLSKAISPLFWQSVHEVSSSLDCTCSNWPLSCCTCCFNCLRSDCHCCVWVCNFINQIKQN